MDVIPDSIFGYSTLASGVRIRIVFMVVVPELSNYNTQRHHHLQPHDNLSLEHFAPYYLMDRDKTKQNDLNKRILISDSRTMLITLARTTSPDIKKEGHKPQKRIIERPGLVYVHLFARALHRVGFKIFFFFLPGSALLRNVQKWYLVVVVPNRVGLRRVRYFLETKRKKGGRPSGLCVRVTPLMTGQGTHSTGPTRLCDGDIETGRVSVKVSVGVG